MKRLVVLALAITAAAMPLTAGAQVGCSSNLASCLEWCTGPDTPFESFAECRHACRALYCV